MQYDERYTRYPVAQGAGCVILRGEQLLLVQEGGKDISGLWHLPMGTVEEHETPQEAAIREVWEEAGVAAQLLHFLGSYLGVYPQGGYVLRHVWLAQAGEINPHPDPNILNRRYFSPEEVETLYVNGELRMHHTWLAYQDALKWLRKQHLSAK